MTRDQAMDVLEQAARKLRQEAAACDQLRDALPHLDDLALKAVLAYLDGKPA